MPDRMAPVARESNPAPRRRGQAALLLAGMVWTAPNTLLGLCLALVGCVFGAHVRWQRREWAWIVSHWPWGDGGALTLGNVILPVGPTLDITCRTYADRAGLGATPCVSLAAHERAHVLQYMLLGPLFLPLYLLCGGISVRNPLERAADRYARCGRGWWPWPDAISRR